MYRKILIPFLFVITIVTVYFYLSQKLIYKSNPKYAGKVSLSGLSEPVQIFRDLNGIPTIDGKNEDDLYFAMGFLHAQDRMWQLDLFRRIATGRLSEVLGTEYIRIDTTVLKLRFERLGTVLFDSLSTATQNVLTAYAAGINAYLKQYPKKIPTEFILLDYFPNQWTPFHTLAIWQLWSWLNSNTETEILNLIFQHSLNSNYLKLFELKPEKRLPEIVKHSFKKNGLNLISQLISVEELTGFPKYSKSSLNLIFMDSLAGNLHKALAYAPVSVLTIPQIWYLQKLVIQNYSVFGASIPGIPVLLSGVNGFIAWSVTPSARKGAQFYLEQYDFSQSDAKVNRNQFYQIDTALVPLSPNDTLVCNFMTLNKRLVLDKFPQNKKSTSAVLTYDWTGFYFNKAFDKLIKMSKSRSLEQFKTILKTNDGPAFRFYCANIYGETCCFETGTRFKPGDRKNQYKIISRRTSKNEIPEVFYHDFPIVPTQQISIAKPVFQQDSILFLEAQHKCEQNDINLVLAAKKYSHTIDPFLQFLDCSFSAEATHLLPLLAKTIQSLENQPDLKNYIYFLKNWDLYEHEESVGATIFNQFIENLITNIFKDELGDSLFNAFNQTPEFVSFALRKLLQDTTSVWYDNVNTENVTESQLDIIQESFLEITKMNQFINKLFPLRWQWGTITKFNISHLLPAGQYKNYLLNSEPVFLKGVGYPLNYVSRVRTARPKLRGRPLQLVYEFTNPANIHWKLSTGNSGHILDNNYKNQTSIWLRGKYNYIQFQSLEPSRDGHRLKLHPPLEE